MNKFAWYIGKLAADLLPGISKPVPVSGGLFSGNVSKTRNDPAPETIPPTPNIPTPDDVGMSKPFAGMFQRQGTPQEMQLVDSKINQLQTPMRNLNKNVAISNKYRRPIPATWNQLHSQLQGQNDQLQSIKTNLQPGIAK